MPAPTEEEIHNFLNNEFGHIEYSKVVLSEEYDYFEVKVILEEKGQERTIGSAAYVLDSTFWEHVRLKFQHVFGTRNNDDRTNTY